TLACSHDLSVGLEHERRDRVPAALSRDVGGHQSAAAECRVQVASCRACLPRALGEHPSARDERELQEDAYSREPPAACAARAGSGSTFREPAAELPDDSRKGVHEIYLLDGWRTGAACAGLALKASRRALRRNVRAGGQPGAPPAARGARDQS